MKMVLVVLNHMVANRMTGQKPQKGHGGGWFYPPLEDAIAVAGLQEVKTDVSATKTQ